MCSGVWYSHYENVLLVLLASPDKEDCKFGIDQGGGDRFSVHFAVTFLDC